MPRVSTTQLRELSMQISRLIDQFSNSGDQYIGIIAAMESVLTAVDTQIVNIDRLPPPA